MMQVAAKNDIIQQLQKEVSSLQGCKKVGRCQDLSIELGPINRAFPGGNFPTGAMHEFLSVAAEDAAATNGFIAGLLGQLMRQGGISLWISTKRTLFPLALKTFGIEPERIIFVDLTSQKDALWAVEEALKCEALAAVVGELKELGFTESRRLQLAVERSGITGFIHRHQPKSQNAVAGATRWKITLLPSETEAGMPGIGYPRWNVQLLKVRNGKPGSWQVEWAPGNFRDITSKEIAIPSIQNRKTG